MILFLISLLILTILSSVAALYIILHELKKVKAINDKILLDQAATVQRIQKVRQEIEAATTPRHIIR